MVTLDTKKIIQAASKRFQDIVTACNKADTQELYGLCLSSLFGEESDLYKDTFNEAPQVKELCDIVNRHDDSTHIKAMLRNTLSVETPNWCTVWCTIRKYLEEMLADWYTNEPTCLITDKAFQVYKICAQIKEHILWECVLAPITQYMEEHICEIKAKSKEDFVRRTLENILN